MQVQMKNGSLQHVSAEVAETLIASGLATEVKPAVAKVPSITFTAARGFEEGDYEHPPRIFYTTGCCGNRGMCESRKGTAHETLTVQHCGVVARVPANVAEQYIALYTKWRSRSRRPDLIPEPPPLPKNSAATSPVMTQVQLAIECGVVPVKK
jgi:hypothetical protein